jgi:hypothetical protein
MSTPTWMEFMKVPLADAPPAGGWTGRAHGRTWRLR